MSAKNQSRRRPKISLTDVGQKIYQPMFAKKTLENWPKKYPRPKSAKKISPTKVGQKNPRWHRSKNSISRCWLKNINSWSRPKNSGHYCPKNSFEQSWSKNTLTNIVWKITLVGVSWKTSSTKVNQKNSRQHRPKK